MIDNSFLNNPYFNHKEQFTKVDNSGTGEAKPVLRFLRYSMASIRLHEKKAIVNKVAAKANIWICKVFRVNKMDDLVERATSESNTTEDWDAIIEICDKINRDSSLAKQVINQIIKKLQHRNLNVVLFTLTLSNSLVQNCSLQVKEEISSRQFLQPLLKMLHSNVHITVRNRILDLIQIWAKDFQGKPSLDYMNQVYKELVQEGIEFPVFQPSPKKQTNILKEKEEEDFQLALAMSLSDQQRVTTPKTPTERKSKVDALFQVKALYDFEPTDSGELQLRKGDIVNVFDNTTYPDWWKGSNSTNVGIFPANYVEKITSTAVGGVIDVDEDEYLLRNLSSVKELKKLISEADPLGHDTSENDRIQVLSLTSENIKK